MRSRRGSQAVEFALILPFFVLLVFGGLDYSWYLLEKHRLHDNTAAACKAGSMSMVGPYMDPYAEALSQMENLIGCDDCTIKAVASPLSNDYVEWIECSVVVNYKPLTGIAPMMPEILSSSSSWPIERFEVDTGSD